MNTPDPAFRTLITESTLDLLSALRDETGFTAAIAVLTSDQKQGLVLASLQGLSDHGYVPRVGSRFYLHATAPGKALLAFMPPATRSKILKHIELKRFTESTLCDEQALNAHIEECSKQQIVYDKGEYVAGVNCVATCITLEDWQPVAAIWITSLQVDLPESDLPKLGRKVLASAKEMQLRVLSHANSSALRHDYSMERAKRFIDEHFHDEEAVRQCHDSFGMSHSHFRRIFREKYGVPPSTYRLQLLHNRARRLLINTNLSIKEIAYQLGYDSQNYFSRAFKKETGLSPAHFREARTR